MRTLPFVILLALPAAAAARPTDEIVPVTGFEYSSDTPSCRMDMCGSVPAPFSNAMLMAPGEWMYTVRVERTRWLGAKDGHHDLGVGEVIGQGFTMAPRDMDMTMTMVEGMVGLDADATFMFMLPYMQSDMGMVMDDGTRFKMRSSGVGDLQIGVTQRALEGKAERMVLYTGVSLPTGSINRKDDSPGFPNGTVDYVMQPGSGTVDLRPALTWLTKGEEWNWGAQLGIVQRLGRNNQGWSAGNERNVSVWAVRTFDMENSASFRLTARKVGNFHGADDDLDPMMSPTQDPNSQAGRRIDAAVGFRAGDFVAEVGAPLYEKLDGPQLSVSWFATLGWQFAF